MEFDLNKLKKRAPYPFETIAVAISFSPRLEAVLSEAKRLSDKLRSALILIHIGPKTNKKEERIDKMMGKLGMDLNHVRVIWMEGNPVNTILRLCKLNIVDLLIIGALKKENILQHYLGSVARNISRKAKCSVLLLTEPNTNENKPGRIIVNGAEGPKTLFTINTALYLSGHYNVNEITLVREVHNPALAMAISDDSTAPESREIRKNMLDEEEEKLRTLVSKSNCGSVKVKQKIINGKPGYAISKYAKDKHSDLLVINSPDTQLSVFDRIFTHDIEFILADLPCNLLIVHSRV